MKISVWIFALLTATSLIAADKLPLQVKKSVAFIFSKDSANQLTPQGTAFFVLLKTAKETDTVNFGYLVTTSSALKRTDGSFFDSLYVRINRKDGYSDTLIVPLSLNGAARYFLHPDSSIDLAIIPAYPDVNRYDILFTPAGMLAPIDFFKREKITEGAELFYTGMLPSHIGTFKNIPIVRFAVISQISDEKYLWNDRYTEFFLIETSASSVGTGSPVYYYAAEDSASQAVPSRFMLAGVIAGSYDHSRAAASGLQRVIPAYKLSELLGIPPVNADRDLEFTRLREARKEKQK